MTKHYEHPTMVKPKVVHIIVEINSLSKRQIAEIFLTEKFCPVNLEQSDITKFFEALNSLGERKSNSFGIKVKR